jgi:DNA-binding transcriptional ArsR family regulator
MDINYERREGRREQAIEVDPDAHDTYSELISSIAIVGEFKTQKEGFVQSFKSDLEPRQPHDDAPEFQLNLSIKGELSRSEYAQAVNGLCKKKNLSPTPQTVSTLAGICDSLYEAASALNRLQPNDDRRTIDAREVRFALSHLGADDILRDTSSTPRTIVMALLDATELLSQSELADEVDVSTRSLRNHLSDLLDIGLIDETPTGYRFNLSFKTADERPDDRYPLYVADPDLRPNIHKAAKALKLAHEHQFRTPIPENEFPTNPTGSNWCSDLRGLDDPTHRFERFTPLGSRNPGGIPSQIPAEDC